MQKLFLLLAVFVFCGGALAQVSVPRESQPAMITQLIGDTNVKISYNRPNIKNRKVWGELVPLGKVWRTGANENTTFEVDRDITVNGQKLPAGKYGLHTIPNQNEWIVIFSKANADWGSFTYDEKKDALRVTAKPQIADFQETMAIGFENIRLNTADAVIAWEKVKVPFTIDVGDVNARTLNEFRKQMGALKADDVKTPTDGANWILTSKATGNYEEALNWVNAGLKNRETFGLLVTKARLLSELGKKSEAIATGEKAVQVGKASTPAANTANFEKTLAGWKAQK